MIGALLAAALAAAPTIEVAHRRVTTDDGLALALYRYRESGRPTHGPPVLLIPDFGFGRELFDLGDRGLARHLAARGRLVYVAELRGQGHASRPSRWHLASLVKRDLPALFRALKEPTVDLVAHGWAGSLLLASVPYELSGRVGRVVAVSTPVDAAVPCDVAEKLLKGGGDLPSLTGDPTGRRALDELFAERASMAPRELGEVYLRARPLGLTASGELLAWMQSGDLQLPGASLKQRLAAFDRPTLALIGLGNAWASADLVAPLRELSPKAKVRLRTFSAADRSTEDYGHLSILLGTGAADEVWPLVTRFLEAER